MKAILICLLSIQYAIGNPLKQKIEPSSAPTKPSKWIKVTGEKGDTLKASEVCRSYKGDCHQDYSEQFDAICGSFSEDFVFGEGSGLFISCTDDKNARVPMLQIMLKKKGAFELETRLVVDIEGNIVRLSSTWTVKEEDLCTENAMVNGLRAELVADSIKAVQLVDLEDKDGRESEELLKVVKDTKVEDEDKKYVGQVFNMIKNDPCPALIG